MFILRLFQYFLSGMLLGMLIKAGFSDDQITAWSSLEEAIFLGTAWLCLDIAKTVWSAKE